MFNSLVPQVVIQEVPGEISLLFSITGCDIGCVGCHSTELWNAANGTPLTEQRFELFLAQYKDFVSCILFFGGEWQPEELIKRLEMARQQGFKTCLYSGRDYISNQIKPHLDYLKLGKYDHTLGGLASTTTNQRFYDLTSNQLINSKFIHP